MNIFQQAILANVGLEELERAKQKQRSETQKKMLFAEAAKFFTENLKIGWDEKNVFNYSGWHLTYVFRQGKNEMRFVFTPSSETLNYGTDMGGDRPAECQIAEFNGVNKFRITGDRYYEHRLLHTTKFADIGYFLSEARDENGNKLPFYNDEEESQ